MILEELRGKKQDQPTGMDFGFTDEIRMHTEETSPSDVTGDLSYADQPDLVGPAPSPFNVVLREFAQMLRRTPAPLTSVLRPPKPGDPNAYRTFLVRVLTHFFLTHGGKPRADLVARTVSTLMNLDPPLEADHLSKLSEMLRIKTWDRADDFMWTPET